MWVVNNTAKTHFSPIKKQMGSVLRENVREKYRHGYGGQLWHLRLLAAMLLLICSTPAASASGSAHMRCNANQFQCGDGSCILQAKMCDGRRDCTDNTDELDCDYKLCRQPHWFPCAQPHGACLAIELKCNGVENCPSGEDEINCPDRLGSSRRRNCSSFEYMCQQDHSCIPLDFMCDGKSDCSDNSDELAGCKQAAASCSSSGHLCSNGRCLQRKEWVCDGVDDCGDGSDEQGCADLCQPELGKFLCRNRMNCLTLSQVCDGHPDCSDNSDESESCHSKPNCTLNQCPPGAMCHMMPTSGRECHCPQGFRLTKFLQKCEDIDECAAQNDGLCSQSCENTSGGYKCLCDEGYELAKDNHTCRVSTGGITEEPLLLYTTQMTVMGVRLKDMKKNGRNHVFQLAGNLSKVIGVAYDGQYTYWTNIQNEAESIVKANADGSDAQILLTSGLDAPEDLAVDWLTQNIYFSDNIMRHIAVCSHDGLNCVVLVTQDVHQPRGLALWPERGQMFWTDWGNKPMIARASMDGSHSLPIVSDNIHWPNGIALDMHQQRIYWVDAKLGSIQTVRPDGTGRRTILEGMLKHPYGLAVFEDELYWSDWGTRSVHVCHKQTGKHHRIVTKDRTIYAVHIYHAAKQPKVKHSCETVRCSHLCLLAETDAGGYSCACPDGMQLSEDQHRCVKTEKRQRLFVGVHSIILEIEHTSFGRHLVSASHSLPCTVSEMVFNGVNGSLIIADNLKRQILEYHPGDNSIRTLVKSNLGNISALAFDYLSRNLYWADAERRVIELLSLQTMHRAIIRFFPGQEIPISLSLMPSEGYLYVALKARRHSHIDKLSMSGHGEQIHVFEEDLGDDDIKMTTDPSTHTLFWSDSDVGRISFTDYRQAQAQLFRGKLRRPYSLALVQQDLFWSELDTPAIYWTHKTNMGPRKRIDIEPSKEAPLIALPRRIPLAGSVPISIAQKQQHPCQQQNGGCSHICVGRGQHTDSVTCLCPPGFVFRDATNRTCIENLDCEFRCRNGECLTLAHRCNGHQDCVDHSDEDNCDAAQKPKQNVMCGINQFSCHNGEQCLSKSQRCDGHKDCLDGSDEQHCAQFDKTKECHQHQFVCDNGKCLDYSLVCDSFNDCGDYSDELKCKTPVKCPSGMFQCSSGSCIAGNWECDGRIDCSDASDEHDKCGQRQCPKNMHRCQLGQCLDRALVCDGHNDCGDRSDELNCGGSGITVNISCAGPLYQCASNLKLCLDPSVRCNGTAECPRGEDEANCGEMCSIYEFQCKSGSQCIRKEFHCDGDRDCTDGSDEVACETQKGNKNQTDGQSAPWSNARRACRPHLFDCQDGDCLDMSRVCNNFPDCNNGNDEGPQCATACRANAGGRPVCQHKCRATPAGAVCSCYDGYRLDTDQRSCVDIDECAEQQPCAQICENTLGSYQCQCHADFMLRQDRISCKSIQSGGSSLIFSSYNEIRNLSDQPVTLSVSWSANDSRINGFDLDMTRNLGYFSIEEQDAIYQIDLHSHNIKRALSIKSPNKMAVDWTTGNVYVLNGGGGGAGGGSTSYQISVCNFEAKMCGNILEMKPKSQMHLKHLTVDAYHARLFYVAVRLERFGPSISDLYMSRLDGSHRELMLHKSSSYITALAIDPHQQYLYYVDQHNRRLERISYIKRSGPSRRPEVLLQKSNAIIRPSGLNVFENHAYIINLGSMEAVQCQLYGSRTCHAINLNVLNAQDIVIASKSRQPIPASNPCEMALCHGMCLLADYGFECMCGSQVVLEGEHCPHGLNHEFEDWMEATEMKEAGSSFGLLMFILVSIILVALAIGLGYLYYQYRQRGHRDLNINLHFQNPLARLNSKTIAEAEQAGIGYGTSTTTSTSSFVPEQFPKPNLMQRLLQTKQTTATNNGKEMANDILFENTRGSELQTLSNGRTRGSGVGQLPLIMVDDTGDDATICGNYTNDDAHARLVP